MKSFRRWGALLVAGLAIGALVLPSVAGAAEAKVGGYRLSVGTRLQAGSNQTYENGEYGRFEWVNAFLGKMGCESAVPMAAELIKNDGNTFEIEGRQDGTPIACLNGQKKLGVTEVEWHNLAATQSGKGTLSMTFTLHEGELTCHYTGSALPFTYSPGKNVIKLSQVLMKAAPSSCGNDSLTAVWDLTESSSEYPNGTPVRLY